MDAKIDILRVKDTNGSEYAVFPKTLIQCVTNENGDNLEDTMKQFITDNLDAEVASKEYVAEQIAGASHLTREIITEIPSAETAKDNVIYMLKVESASGNDMYQEYQLINGEVVMVGDTSVDLSGYVKNETVEAIVDGTTTVAKASEAIKSTFDGNDNNIAETYATKANVDKIQTTSLSEIGGFGWYRVAEINTLDGSFHNCDISIKTAYYNTRPEYAILRVRSIHNVQEIICLDSQCDKSSRLISAIRTTYDSSKAYIEIYYASSTTNGVRVSVFDAISAYGDDGWRTITAVATSETVDGVTVTTTYDIPANARPAVIGNALNVKTDNATVTASLFPWDAATYVRNLEDDTNYSDLWMSKNTIEFHKVIDGVYSSATLLHTGNKPSGTYTGNGDATPRDIATGGIGNLVAIWCNDGGIVFANPVHGIAINGSGECHIVPVTYINGVLSLTTNDHMLNADGITYYYQVL